MFTIAKKCKQHKCPSMHDKEDMTFIIYIYINYIFIYIILAIQKKLYLAICNIKNGP